MAGEPIDHAQHGWRSRIGVLSHQSFLYARLTAAENLRFYGRLYGVAELEREIEVRLVEVGLWERRDDTVQGFSRGMQQRLALARTLLHGPELVLLDEPYTGLDPHAARMLRGVLETLRDGRRTVVLVTHNLSQGLELADRVVVQVAGRWVSDEPRAAVDVARFEQIYTAARRRDGVTLPAAPSFLRQVITIAGKDLRLEWRSRERLMSMLTFAVLVAVVFSFALDPTIRARGLAGAMLWVTILFAGMLGLGRSFSLEREQDTMTGILLAPLDRGALYLGKFLANLALLVALVLVVFPVYGLFFQLSLGGAIGGLALVVGLAIVGFMALGTLFSAIAANTRLGETLLPILLIPLLLPVIIFAAGATQRLLIGRPLEEVMSSVRMLAAFDLVFIIVGVLVFASVVEE